MLPGDKKLQEFYLKLWKLKQMKGSRKVPACDPFISQLAYVQDQNSDFIHYVLMLLDRSVVFKETNRATSVKYSEIVLNFFQGLVHCNKKLAQISALNLSVPSFCHIQKINLSDQPGCIFFCSKEYMFQNFNTVLTYYQTYPKVKVSFTVSVYATKVSI